MARLTGSYSWVGGAAFGGGEGVAQAFDNSSGSKLCNTNFAGNFWMVMDCTNFYLLDPTYQIWSANDSAERDPRNWTVQGSPDNSNWTTLDTVSGQGSWGSRQSALTFTHDTVPTAYRYFRWNCTANQSSGIMQISEFQLFGTQAYFVTVNQTGSGSISPSSKYVASGGNQDFVVTPAAGWQIKSITRDGTPQTVTNKAGMTYSLTSVSAATTVAVTFERKKAGFLLFM